MTTFPARALLVAQAHELSNLGRLVKDRLNPEEVAASLVRLVGCGWTLEQIEAVCVGPDGSGRVGDMRARLMALDALKHLSQDELVAWVDAFDGHLPWRQSARDEMEHWRITVPGPLGALCFAAGLTPAEAAERLANGELNEEALRTMAALRKAGTKTRL